MGQQEHKDQAKKCFQDGQFKHTERLGGGRSMNNDGAGTIMYTVN